jgi:hypothetical protein
MSHGWEGPTDDLGQVLCLLSFKEGNPWEGARLCCFFQLGASFLPSWGHGHPCLTILRRSFRIFRVKSGCKEDGGIHRLQQLSSATVPKLHLVAQWIPDVVPTIDEQRL